MQAELLIAVIVLFRSAATGAEKLKRWLYIQTNLLPDESVAQLEQFIIRAGKAGYDHALIAQSKFSRLAEMGDKYFKHVTHVREVAAQGKVPAVRPLPWEAGGTAWTLDGIARHT